MASATRQATNSGEALLSALEPHVRDQICSWPASTQEGMDPPAMCEHDFEGKGKKKKKGAKSAGYFLRLNPVQARYAMQPRPQALALLWYLCNDGDNAAEDSRPPTR